MNGQATLGEALKNQGMVRAYEAADGDWKNNWSQAIALLASIGEPFTSDEVREIAGAPWDHPNAAGALFHKAARAGLIRSIGYRKSERSTLHKHPLTLWVGVEGGMA